MFWPRGSRTDSSTIAPVEDRALEMMSCALLSPTSARSAASTCARVESCTAFSCSGESTQSPRPTEHPRRVSQEAAILCRSLSMPTARAFPRWRQVSCTKPPGPDPSAFFLLSTPDASSPSRTNTRRCCMKASPSKRRRCGRKRVTRGRAWEIACRPVKRRRGLSTAGTGISWWSEWWQLATRSMKRERSSSVPGRESRCMPIVVSCTQPMMGQLDCAPSIWEVMLISPCTSAAVSTSCGVCMFISSPSKSALYGVVSGTGSRKVRPFMILTRCPIMDPVCSVGCRLNTTQSPSRRWRSTVMPGLSCSFFRKALEQMLRLQTRPCPMCTFEAPPTRPPPMRTHLVRRSRFRRVTLSGTVCLAATCSGTPRQSMSMEASGVMTVRLLKFTRLPMMLFRMRPRFPFIRPVRLRLLPFELMARRARDRPIPKEDEELLPGVESLSMYMAMWLCRTVVHWAIVSGSPFSIAVARALLLFTMSCSLTVR